MNKANISSSSLYRLNQKDPRTKRPIRTSIAQLVVLLLKVLTLKRVGDFNSIKNKSKEHTKLKLNSKITKFCARKHPSLFYFLKFPSFKSVCVSSENNSFTDLQHQSYPKKGCGAQNLTLCIYSRKQIFFVKLNYSCLYFMSFLSPLETFFASTRLVSLVKFYFWSDSREKVEKYRYFWYCL